MLSYGDYLSLLQVGFGLGIGLSFFRAPLDLRLKKLEGILTSELAVYKGANGELATWKVRSLRDIGIRTRKANQNVDKWSTPFLAASLVLAAVNLGALYYCTIHNRENVVSRTGDFFLFISTWAYIVIAFVMEILARIMVVPLLIRAKDIANSTEVPSSAS